jgi:energy-coupling factor transporter ATP-binding protein EcfA2
MPNFVKSVRIPSLKPSNSLELAYPDAAHPLPGCITVICGPNGSGKSYILKAMTALLRGKRAAPNFRGWSLEAVDPTDQTSWKFLRIQHFQQKNGAGVLSDHWLKTTIVEPTDTRKLGLSLFFDVFSACAATRDLLKNVSRETFVAAGQPIAGILGAIQRDELRIYYLDRKLDFVALLEKDLGGVVGFRATKDGIELTLTTSSGNTAPYPDWSDGQKALFFIFNSIHYARPDILLLDEIENYLHPIFMTRALEFVRMRVPQTIVMTHHPHVIFSEFIDRVAYIEMEPSANPEGTTYLVEQHKKPYFQPTPPRRLSTLANAFDKLSAVYRLFDYRDRQLLKHAVQITEFCSEEFYAAVLKCFDVDIFDSRQGGLPDRQTLILSQFIAASSANKVAVLDWGAGRGRTIGEMGKLGRWRFPKTIDWHCWEFFEDVRNKLRQNKAVQQTGAKVLNDLSELPDHSADYCILANVLHELTPAQCASALSECARKLKSQGAILICDIYPLLHAEKFAVPYRESDLVGLLDACNFAAATQQFTVHDASAYALSARWRGQDEPVIDADAAEAKIWSLWNDAERRSLNSYLARDKPASYEQYKNFLQDLTAVASIAAARQGIWR